MNVVFRVDSSDKIGSGHVMRCLVFAKALRDAGDNIKFVCRDLQGNIIRNLEESLFETVILRANASEPLIDVGYGAWLGVSQDADANEVIECLGDSPIDWMVVDSYALDERWEKRITSLGCRILAIDDLANRKHQCDVVVDANYVEGFKRRYQRIIPSACTALLGPDYCLIAEKSPRFSANRLIGES